MRILIVEDYGDKRASIVKYFQNRYKDAVMEEAKSYSTGISKIYAEKWDLIILDMSLPTYDITNSETGGEKKPTAGKEILRRMANRRIFTPAIIITQFDVFGDKQISLDVLNAEFGEKYGDIWHGTVSYDKVGWQLELDTLLEKIKL